MDFIFTEAEIECFIKEKQDFIEGKITARNWEDIDEDLKNRFDQAS